MSGTTTLRIANPVLETGSRASLLALQERRLLAQVRRCAARIPFYRERWPKAGAVTSLAAFKDLIPFTAKPDFLGSDDTVMTDRLARPGSRPYALHLTSGTTGLGQEVHTLTRYDQEASASTWVYQARWAGLEPGDSVFYTFPVGLQTGGLWSSHASDRMASLGFHMGPYSTDKKVDYMLRFRPHGLIASPAYLTQLQANLQDRGVHPRDALPNLKALFIAGESYTVDWATRATDYWGATLSEWYGSMQGGLNQCFSCERGVVPGGARGCLHSMEHRILCEVLDPDTGEQVEPGEEGEMVITSLYKEGFPVIRFRTGDRVRYLGLTCPCGRPFASIEAGNHRPLRRHDEDTRPKPVAGSGGPHRLRRRRHRGVCRDRVNRRSRPGNRRFGDRVQPLGFNATRRPGRPRFGAGRCAPGEAERTDGRDRGALSQPAPVRIQGAALDRYAPPGPQLRPLREGVRTPRCRCSWKTTRRWRQAIVGPAQAARWAKATSCCSAA